MLFRTMQFRGPRARASKAPFPSFVNMQVYSVQRRNHMCIIESGIATGSWRFARRVHRGVMRTRISNIPCRTSTIRTIN